MQNTNSKHNVLVSTFLLRWHVQGKMSPRDTWTCWTITKRESICDVVFVKHTFDASNTNCLGIMKDSRFVRETFEREKNAYDNTENHYNNNIMIILLQEINIFLFKKSSRKVSFFHRNKNETFFSASSVLPRHNHSLFLNYPSTSFRSRWEFERRKL